VRRHGAGRVLNLLGDFSRLNRRMHVKTFTVDDAATIIGGRNIGDEYFDAHAQLNFRDRDVVALGPWSGTPESCSTRSGMPLSAARLRS